MGLQHPAGRRRVMIAAAILAGSQVSATAQAKQEPLLEFGLGAGAVAFQDYRGSDTTRAYPVPVPYLVYNGKFLKADREGLRGLLFNQEWAELALSGNATTPVRNDRARSGMPNLRSTLELGPSLNFHLLHSEDSRLKLDLRMPFRSALILQASPKPIGWTFTPQFALDVADPFGLSGWHAGLLAGPLFAARRYNDYFYSVATPYATAARPAYAAAGGFAGTQTVGAVSKRFPRFWFGAYARYDSLVDAAFVASPLVKRHDYWSAGFGFAWMIHRSAEMVEVAD